MTKFVLQEEWVHIYEKSRRIGRTTLIRSIEKFNSIKCEMMSLD